MGLKSRRWLIYCTWWWAGTNAAKPREKARTMPRALKKREEMQAKFVREGKLLMELNPFPKRFKKPPGKWTHLAVNFAPNKETGE